METRQALPNFFIVGAPKSGTTSLYHCLDQHPDIYMSPVKEPSFFASDIRLELLSQEARPLIRHDPGELRAYLDGPMQEKGRAALVLEWEDYLKLFKNVRNETAIGEASVCYLWSETAALNIRQRVPAAKIIMVLRNPVERAFSQYLQALASGWVRSSFREVVELDARRNGCGFSILYPLLDYGRYYQQVQRYLQAFPADRVRIYLYEDYQLQTPAVFEDIFRFLNVAADFQVDSSKKYMEPLLPRVSPLGFVLRRPGLLKKAREVVPSTVRTLLRRLSLRPRDATTMDPNDRAYLVNLYREDIRMLSELLGRDLSMWLK
jgi:hypothetical protein